ncbi:MAG: DEAD/DEAH box helicase family protein [Thermotogota bacterium]|nr:DEAD/DEAH box helicase family protein [Thermotogota bacterium]
MSKRVTLKFKHQKFQEEAAKSVVDCFTGQPNQRLSQYTFDSGYKGDQASLYERIGYMNSQIRLSKERVFENIREVQKMKGLKISPKLEGRYNLTVDMETGTGKTYTYIKTMYELNRAYGWNKFIVVVPSIAIREGVFKAFQITQDHFLEDYGKKIRYFIYNSRQLTKLDAFATDSGINCMIINSQAFNARGKDARRIYMELDEFQSRKPIDVLAQTQPIMIIDEPQSVEGPQTQKSLKAFQPLFTLRYSATHRKEYNKIYRLDALDAYNQKLVKKISVKGIDVKGSTGSSGYLYFEGVELRGRQKPVARLEYEHKTNAGIRKRVRLVNEGDHLYEHSGGLEEYRGVSVLTIDGARNLIEFSNGTILHPGETVGDVSEKHLRRIQIREAIRSHIEKEMSLFHKNIKVLSLFFIDEVAKYKQYDENNQAVKGMYADMFEEEYLKMISQLEGMVSEDYWDYVHCDAGTIHNGYFSIDKNRRLVNTKVKYQGKKNEFVDDVDAYDLIMKDKERLLSFDEPNRFIFSHSALKEGWDNPNVFQICTLKHSDSSIRKQQEVGRGLRLCVNGEGDRMDANVPGIDVHAINTLTVIASESYKDFASTFAKGDCPVPFFTAEKGQCWFLPGQKTCGRSGQYLDHRLR